MLLSQRITVILPRSQRQHLFYRLSLYYTATRFLRSQTEHSYHQTHRCTADYKIIAVYDRIMNSVKIRLDSRITRKSMFIEDYVIVY